MSLWSFPFDLLSSFSPPSRRVRLKDGVLHPTMQSDAQYNLTCHFRPWDLAASVSLSFANQTEPLPAFSPSPFFSWLMDHVDMSITVYKYFISSNKISSTINHRDDNHLHLTLLLLWLLYGIVSISASWAWGQIHIHIHIHKYQCKAKGIDSSVSEPIYILVLTCISQVYHVSWIQILSIPLTLLPHPLSIWSSISMISLSSPLSPPPYHSCDGTITHEHFLMRP